ERIAKAHGSQCGFCTPGMVMSMYTLLRNNPQPTMEDVTEGLAGNLCRCTGYRPIVDGYRTFCESENCCQLNGSTCNMSNGNENGSVEPIENGQPELFSKGDLLPLDPTQDLIFPPELMRLAEVKDQTTQRFCGERMTWISPGSLNELLQLKADYPQAPLVMGNTNIGLDMKFKGIFHPVIISPTQVPELFKVTQKPEDGRRRVPIDKDFFLGFAKTVLKPDEIVLSVFIPASRPNEIVHAFRHAPRKESALATVNAGMRVWFNENSNVVKEISIYYGGVGATILSADRACQQIVGRPWEEATLSDVYSTLVDEIKLGPSAPGGKVDFRRSLTLSLFFKFNLLDVTQVDIPQKMQSAIQPLPKHIQPGYQEFQEAVAETLGIPSNRVSCHVKRLGGAFGGKVTKTAILASITAVAASKTGRPVRCVLERGEDMLITGGRHPVGFMKDGRITAADFQYYANAGNVVDESVLVAEKILLHLDNAYNIPNLRGRSAACKTNLPSNTAFRGFGVPQCMLVVESMIDDVALKLGRLPEEIREINMYKEVSLTHYKMEFDPENLVRCWNECMKKADFRQRRQGIDLFNQQNQFKKRGIAIVPIKYGIGFAEAFLNQVASRELNIPTSLIHISETSTQCVPNTCPSAASFGTDANGMAVKDACQILYNRLEPIRKKNPKGTWQNWIITAFLQKISLSATGYYRGHDLDMDWEKQEGKPYAYFTYAVGCSEVELDCLTGEYRTLRTDIVVDIGRSINPSIDIGQIEGAFMQGLGLYTMEELKFSPSGVLYTRGPSQYKIPSFCDVPLKFNVYLLAGSSNPHAIYSSKGIGEPTVFLGSSVFFAIKDAVTAARKDAGLTGPFQLNSPATPERACLACATHFTQMVAQSESTSGPAQPWALNI
ncbi:hypothetical protein cypCar_00043759, partial [Cyprinus carpio]